MIGLLPLVSFIVTVIFATQVFRRWWGARDRTYLLVWWIGLLWFAIANLTGALYNFFGWQDAWGGANFRIWYLTGAILVAAWLGQGTVFLLWRRVARPTLVVLMAASVFAAIWVFTASMNSTPLTENLTELTGIGVMPDHVRLLTPFFNIYGVVTLAGGALWSAFVLWRRGVYSNRMAGNIVIALGALGALAPAAGGALTRFGLPGLYVGNLVGALLMLAGFLLVTREVRAPTLQPATVQQPAG